MPIQRIDGLTCSAIALTLELLAFFRNASSSRILSQTCTRHWDECILDSSGYNSGRAQVQGTEATEAPLGTR